MHTFDKELRPHIEREQKMRAYQPKTYFQLCRYECERGRAVLPDDKI